MKLKKWQLGCLISLAILACSALCLLASVIFTGSQPVTAPTSPPPADTAVPILLPTGTPLPPPIETPDLLLTDLYYPTRTIEPMVCNCDGDDLDCPDFASPADAQNCFSYCARHGYDDIFLLDSDEDGFACEVDP